MWDKKKRVWSIRSRQIFKCLRLLTACNYMQTLYCAKNVWPRKNNATHYALVLTELIGFMHAIVLFFPFCYFGCNGRRKFANGNALCAKYKIRFWFKRWSFARGFLRMKKWVCKGRNNNGDDDDDDNDDDDDGIKTP